MIDTKHTQGRWRVDEQASGFGIKADGDFRTAGLVARLAISPHGSRRDEGRANAHLISAAPEMLQALMEFVSSFSTVPGSIGDEVREGAKAAIAKACNVPIEELGR